MSKVFVKYGLIFDPKRTWDDLTSFEKDLNEFFKSKGLRAEFIETMGEDAETVILSIEPIPEPIEAPLSFDKDIDGKVN